MILAILYILALFLKIVIHCMKPQSIRVPSIIFQNHNYFLKLLKCTYCQFLWTILSFNSMKMYYIWLKILFGESNSKNLMKCSLVNRSKIVWRRRAGGGPLFTLFECTLTFFLYYYKKQLLNVSMKYMYLLQLYSCCYFWIF